MALSSVLRRSGKGNARQLPVFVEGKGAYLFVVLSDDQAVGIGTIIGWPYYLYLVVTRRNSHITVGIYIVRPHTFYVFKGAPYRIRLIVLKVVTWHLHMDIYHCQ